MKKIQITKCYLVQIVDEEGNEIACEYVFADRKQAEKTGKKLKEEMEGEIHG